MTIIIQVIKSLIITWSRLREFLLIRDTVYFVMMTSRRLLFLIKKHYCCSTHSQRRLCGRLCFIPYLLHVVKNFNCLLHGVWATAQPQSNLCSFGEGGYCPPSNGGFCPGAFVHEKNVCTPYLIRQNSCDRGKCWRSTIKTIRCTLISRHYSPSIFYFCGG